MEKLSQAIALAVRAHDGQFDKANFPYIAHPFRVMEKLHFEGHSEEMLIAAILHDTVEDTSVTLNLIRNEFGIEVRNLVDAVSRRKDETYTEFIDRVRVSGSKAITLKLADMADNSDPHRPSIPHLTERYQKAKDRLLS